MSKFTYRAVAGQKGRYEVFHNGSHIGFVGRRFNKWGVSSVCGYGYAIAESTRNDAAEMLLYFVTRDAA